MSVSALTAPSYALNCRRQIPASQVNNGFAGTRSISSRSSHAVLQSLLTSCHITQHRCSVAAHASHEHTWDAAPPCQLSPAVLDLHGIGMCSQPEGGTELGLPVWDPENWEFGRSLGSGSFGSVYQAIDLTSGRSWAVKTLSKSPALSGRPVRGTGRVSRRKLLARLRREIDTLQQLDGCESAIGFEGAFESETHVYIVMEVVDNDDLSDIFRKQGPIPERQAAMLVYEVLRIVRCCHSANILHGDIKPSNFLLKKDNPLTAVAAQASQQTAPSASFDALTGAFMSHSSAAPSAADTAAEVAPVTEAEPYKCGWLKGVDFGCSNDAPPGVLLCKMTGTPAFMAPEVFARSFSLPADMWSVGMLAYQAIANRLPYWNNEEEMYGSTMVDVRTAVSQAPIPLDYGPWHSISATGRSLIDSLLTHDPAVRLTAEEAQVHPWFVEQGICTAVEAAASHCAAAACHLDQHYPMGNVLPMMHRISSTDSLRSVSEDSSRVAESC